MLVILLFLMLIGLPKLNQIKYDPGLRTNTDIHRKGHTDVCIYICKKYMFVSVLCGYKHIHTYLMCNLDCIYMHIYI